MPRPVISGPLSVSHNQSGAYDNQAFYDSRYSQQAASASPDLRAKRAQRPHHDSYQRPHQSTSSRYNSESERKPGPARKRARFAVEGEVSQDWVCTRTPISPLPPAHSEAFSSKTRPLPTPLQTPHTSSSRTMVSQRSSTRTMVDHSVRVPEAPFSPTRKSPVFPCESSPFVQNKPLPTPPNPQTFSLAIESLYEEHAKPTLTSTPGSNELMPQRESPHIIRTQQQSYSFGGSLKAIWKKTTAQIRVVRQAGLAAIMSPAVADRDSVLWSGFSKVPVPPTEASEGSSIRTRSSNSSVRSSGWWRSREIAIVESSDSERMEMMSTKSAESGSYRTARTRRSSESHSPQMFA
ncbi:hypothetical protein FRC04_007171 [Tulasnella sp. 424]|nr:hypothetical protein FRC04_007171 [Tulasnella sp. 424]KAG8974608.1 hypothetical protein FRC05_007084 [Tulasnella sp. 425]